MPYNVWKQVAFCTYSFIHQKTQPYGSGFSSLDLDISKMTLQDTQKSTATLGLNLLLTLLYQGTHDASLTLRD